MANNLKQAPDIGKRLRSYVKEHRIFQSAWARLQGVSAKQVARYLKQGDMRVGTLFSISQILKYNFLREIADMLPAEFPPHQENPLAKRVAELEQENADLALQLNLLKEIMGKK